MYRMIEEGERESRKGRAVIGCRWALPFSRPVPSNNFRRARAAAVSWLPSNAKQINLLLLSVLLSLRFLYLGIGNRWLYLIKFFFSFRLILTFSRSTWNFFLTFCTISIRVNASNKLPHSSSNKNKLYFAYNANRIDRKQLNLRLHSESIFENKFI